MPESFTYLQSNDENLSNDVLVAGKTVFPLAERRMTTANKIALCTPASKNSRNGAFEARNLFRKQCLNLFFDFICGRIPKTIRVNDFLLINIDAKLTEPAFNRFYFYVVFYVQLGCNTGS
jgi:hypothetical protein